MSQEHLDRLTAIDASFLHQEGPTSHMHVGALALLRGPAAAVHEVLDTLRGRLHLVPRYRQKLAVPPAGTGRPLWVDDPSFSLEYHVRHTALPQPGLRGAAAAAGRADLLPAARPLQAAVGGVDGRGPRGRRLRADLQDPSRADRRDRGRRHRAGHVRPRPGAGRGPAPRRGVAARAGADAARRCSPRARSGLLRTGVRTARRGGVAGHAPGRGAALGARGGRGPRRGRVGGAEPGARRRR